MKRSRAHHTKFQELISARLDGPLTRAELRSLTSHLKSCADCTAVERDYSDQRARLRGLAAPLPPRDLWARTSAALDREVARGAPGRAQPHGTRRGRAPGPMGALITSIIAVGVVAAVAVMEIGPVFRAAPVTPPLATPFSIAPQALAFIGSGAADIAIYRTQVGHVCPASAPDCVISEGILRTPVGLPPSMRARTLALSPNGLQLALVGRYVDEDVFAIVTFDEDAPSETPPAQTSTDAPVTQPPATSPPSEQSPTATTVASASPVLSTPSDSHAPVLTDQPSEGTPNAPSQPPASAVPGMRVLSILEDVDGAGAPPAWSPGGDMLAFSAMPADASHGPDVYVWSPADAQARALTSDHTSYFASWIGAEIIASRVINGQDESIAVATVVIDPLTAEERQLGGPPIWLPALNPQGTLAVAWYGELGLADGLVAPRIGSLYLTAWPAESPPAPTPSAAPTNDIESAAPQDSAAPAGLSALDPQRDPRSAPVIDWQVRWSADGKVLGVWIADAPSSPWGRLVVTAVDPDSGRLLTDQLLLSPTLARRGFSLGLSRVVWVAPADDSPDGELRIRSWGDDGVGGLRLAPGQLEEFVPAF